MTRDRAYTTVMAQVRRLAPDWIVMMPIYQPEVECGRWWFTLVRKAGERRQIGLTVDELQDGEAVADMVRCVCA